MRPISRVTAWCLAGALAARRKRRQQHRFEDLLHRQRPPPGLRLELPQQRQVLLPQRAETPLEHRLHQADLGAEIVIDRGQVHPRLPDNVPQRCARKPRLRDRVLGRVQNAGLRVWFEMT